ncbi:DUF4192 domain-containing protein [Williamsia deligens]|uniref:DUF4192 domain-containing protein n=1 Tax=Williamsia deligens TaxID=321325 RepID=A0ABW3GBF5_9NOCA|nr:DUF4192 domain-containing protein [Williamsia deligens]MCP2195414.1 protein of unknown function (DUF4192) [Williamsia deligens]
MDIDHHTLTLRDPGDLIAAVPPMLGFVPARSLVVISFSGPGSRLGITMRHDIVLDDDGGPAAVMCDVVDHLVTVAAREGASSVAVIVVDDRAPADDPRWEALVADVEMRLGAIDLGAAFAVPEMRAGARWYAVGRGRGAWTGLLPDPATTPTALARAVTSGTAVRPSRAAMVAALDPTAPCTDVDCPHHDVRDTPARNGSRRADAARLRSVLVMLDGRVLSCADTATLAAAIAVPRVRDALLALSASSRAEEAGALWTDLTRRCRGRARADAATLLAHWYYTRGEGTFAGIALDAALTAFPPHSMAGLLDQSLRAGLPPSMLTGLLVTSCGVADDLGVRMPPVVPEALDPGA